MKILITGVTGFAGCHLVSWLSQRQGSAVELFGLSRRGRWPAGFKQLKKCLRVLRFDWSSPRPLATLLRDLKPEAIFHLAGDTNVAGSFRAPSLAWKANWRTTFFLFEALRAWGGRPRVLLASSGAVYGQAEEVVTEQTELRPNSPYGASKAAADLLAGQVWRSDGIPTIRARLFNVCGPGLPPTLALGSFVQQIVAIERGRARPVLQTGKLSTARDYLHIRDVVRCYVELLQKGAPGEAYNLASGRGHATGRLLDLLLGLAKKKIEVRTARARLRPADAPRLRVDATKLERALGWKPAFAPKPALAEMLEFARRQER